MLPDRFHNKHSLIMSTGRGKMIVEFFSALILLRVWPDNCQSDCWCNWGRTSHSPAGTSAGAPRSSRPWRDWRLPGTWRPSARPPPRSPSLSPPWQPPPRRPSLFVAAQVAARPYWGNVSVITVRTFKTCWFMMMGSSFQTTSETV